MNKCALTEMQVYNWSFVSSYSNLTLSSVFSVKLGFVKSIPWRLAEFFLYNKDLHSPYNGTVHHPARNDNTFLCRLVLLLKSKTHQLNFEGGD